MSNTASKSLVYNLISVLVLTSHIDDSNLFYMTALNYNVNDLAALFVQFQACSYITYFIQIVKKLS